MLRIGAHMSVAGGVSRAVDRAVLHGCEALQIFSRNASRWKAPALDPDEVRRFRQRTEDAGLSPVVAHASYLINLATTLPALRAQSIAALADELDRAAMLGLLGVVLHPGACTAGTVEEALRLVALGIRDAFAAAAPRPVMVLIEHTAGQGRTVGHRFDQIAAILSDLDGSLRVGVCLDTCHLLAAGYDIVSEEGYRATLDDLDRTIGLDRVQVLHANDSRTPLGSRVDRHQHIGDGYLGLEPFWRLLHDRRLAGRPLLIETAKDRQSDSRKDIALDPLDVRNLETLRHLRSASAPSGSAPQEG